MSQAKVVVTVKDCRRETFRCGGHGGQNVNKRETGVRFVHVASGAVGECREHRTQAQNERVAWSRMAETLKFKMWYQAELAALEAGFASLERRVDAALAPENLAVEEGVGCRSDETVCLR